MPMTNFPYGFASGLSVRGVPLIQAQPGNALWVDNSPGVSGGTGPNPLRSVGGSDNNPGTFTRPLATIQQALTRCSHGNGDIIFVKPGHIETVIGAGTTQPVYDPSGTITVSAQSTLALNTGGVAIIGLGAGANRPEIHFTTAAGANIPVRSAGVSIQNVVFFGGFAAVASCFTAQSASCATSTIVGTTLTTGAVTGTLYPGATLVGTLVIPGTMVLAQLTGTTGGTGTYLVDTYHYTSVTSTTITAGPQDFNLEGCEFRDRTSVLNLVTVFTGSATANMTDGFRFANNRVSSLGTTATTTVLKPTAAADRWVVKNNFIVQAAVNDTASLITGGALALTNLDVGGNVIHRPNTSATGGLLMTSSSTACTGHMYDNYVWSLTATPVIVATGTKLAFTNNLLNNTGVADKSGLVLPATA